MPSAFLQIFDGPGKPFRAVEQPLPNELMDGEVLVKIELASICGSDLHTISGVRKGPTPTVLGHEGVGRIVGLGNKRSGLTIGDRVTWTLADSCGVCNPCQEHRLPEKCRSLFKYGHAAVTDGSGLSGCYASHIFLRAGTHVVRVPDHLSDMVMVPANCALATMVNVVGSIPEKTKSVVIQGGGLLGLYGCALLRERGVEQIFCVDVRPERLSKVPAFGGIPVDGRPEHYPEARARILESADGGVDAVLEVAGVAALVPEGVQLLRAGGFYGFVGMVHPNSALTLTGEQVIRKCLTIRGFHNYSPWHLDQAVQFLSDTVAKYPYESLVRPPLPLSCLEEAVKLAQTQEWFRVSVRTEF
ncbi:MAG: alcohol dehydrogenase catalytic domain-containing protein [Verrucomicrobia bacterium]|nr:alcohol dehydrogenase catalytic domain-containing protein [Verrucomicrobiota bacterium]